MMHPRLDGSTLHGARGPWHVPPRPWSVVGGGGCARRLAHLPSAHTDCACQALPGLPDPKLLRLTPNLEPLFCPHPPSPNPQIPNPRLIHRRAAQFAKGLPAGRAPFFRSFHLTSPPIAMADYQEEDLFDDLYVALARPINDAASIAQTPVLTSTQLRRRACSEADSDTSRSRSRSRSRTAQRCT
jgi:hypothetical protein